MDFIDSHTMTLERLMRLAADGHLSKDKLAQLLVPEQRNAYADACGAIENGYTNACRAEGDHCLESGCSIDAGEVCLQPLLRAGIEYQKKCAEEWARLFSDPRNRVDEWRTETVRPASAA